MKIESHARARTGDVREAAGRVKLTAETEEEAKFLAMLAQTLLRNEPVEFPARDTVYFTEGVHYTSKPE